MIETTKSIALGCFLSIGLGILTYLTVVFYLILVNEIKDSILLVDTIRSRQAMHMSLPYTLAIMVLATIFAIKKSPKQYILVSVSIILITAASITSGPLKIISIHMNYLPIVLGGILGAWLGKRRYQPTQ